jgi:DtxR family Mn-dependent transcriptional regulator
MASQTVENYLKAIFHLAQKNQDINPTELAQSLSVSVPTVNSMAKKMAALAYIEYEKYKPLRLTEKGRKEAALIIRKHRLIEMYLVEKMGFGWEEVHQIAEQIEHLKAPLFFERIDQILGFPKYDPHGSPIPNKNGEIEQVFFRPLAECQIGNTLILRGLRDSSEDFIKYLNAKNLTLGTKIEVLKIEDFDKNMTISYQNPTPFAEAQQAVLSELVCAKLLVEETF